MGLSGIQGNFNPLGMWNLDPNRPEHTSSDSELKHTTRAEKDSGRKEVGLSPNGFALFSALSANPKSLAFDPEAGLASLPDINNDLDQDEKMSWIRNLAGQIIEMPVSNEEKARLLSQYFYQNRQVLACLLVFIREQDTGLFLQLLPLLESDDNPSALIKEEMDWLNVRLASYVVVDDRVLDESNLGEEVDLLAMSEGNFFDDILKGSFMNYFDDFYAKASVFAEIGEKSTEAARETNNQSIDSADRSNLIQSSLYLSGSQETGNFMVNQVQNQFLEGVQAKIDQAFSFVAHASKTNARREVQRLVQQLLNDLKVEENRFVTRIAHNKQEARRLEVIPQGIRACYEYVLGQAQNLSLA